MIETPYGHPMPGQIVADAAALQAIAAADRHDGMQRLLADGSCWRFISGSAVGASAGYVIAPAAGTGRWHKVIDGSDATLTNTRTPSATCITSAMIRDASAENGLPVIIRRAIAAGEAGAADDVEIVAALSRKMRVVDVQFRCTAGNAATRTVTLRDTVGGAGNALSDALDCAAAGRKEQAGASAVAAAGALLTLYRSHDAVAGELIITLVPEA